MGTKARSNTSTLLQKITKSTCCGGREKKVGVLKLLNSTRGVVSYKCEEWKPGLVPLHEKHPKVHLCFTRTFYYRSGSMSRMIKTKPDPNSESPTSWQLEWRLDRSCFRIVDSLVHFMAVQKIVLRMNLNLLEYHSFLWHNKVSQVFDWRFKFMVFLDSAVVLHDLRREIDSHLACQLALKTHDLQFFECQAQSSSTWMLTVNFAPRIYASAPNTYHVSAWYHWLGDLQ